MVSAMLWGGDLGMEGVQKSGDFAGEIPEMGNGCELELPRLYAERGIREREIGVQAKKKGVEF